MARFSLTKEKAQMVVNQSMRSGGRGNRIGATKERTGKGSDEGLDGSRGGPNGGREVRGGN